MAPARDVRGPVVGSRVAVPDRDECLPRRARQAPAEARHERRDRLAAALSRHLLEQLPDRREGPEDVALAKETVELAFIAAIQHLAPLPRAVLVLRDVLGCSARETARLLETTEASVNSALQRARGGLRHALPEDREAWRQAAEVTAAERELLARYVECSERVDVDGLAALLHSGVRFSMPPYPGGWTGRSAVVEGWIDGGFGSEGIR